MIEIITFLILAAILIGSAVFVVMSKHLFHAALVLMLFLFTMAVMFVHLKAELVAVMQVLTYVGGVVTFILFVIMMTKKLSDMSVERFNSQKVISILITLGILASFIVMAYFSFNQPLNYNSGDNFNDITTIGKLLLSDYILSFELISIILTVVMIGAIILVKKEDN